MPKMKSNASARKRFKKTASGQFKRKKAYNSHILTKKSRKRKRELGKSALVDKTNLDKVKRMLPGVA